jgi:hypothetical protein
MTSNTTNPSQISIRDLLPTASNHGVALKSLYQQSIDALVKHGDIEEGELIIVQVEGVHDSEYFELRSTSKRSVEEILKKAFPEKFEKPFSVESDTRGHSFKSYNLQNDDRPMNRAERRAKKRKR